MDVEKEIIEQCESLKNNMLARFQDVKNERDKLRSEYEELNTSFKTLYEKLTDKQNENERLMKLNEELEIRNTELHYQLQTSEDNRSKLQEKFDRIKLDLLKETESQKINVEELNEEETCLERIDPDIENALNLIDERTKQKRDDEIEEIESLKGYTMSTQFENAQEYGTPENNPRANLNVSTQNYELLEKMYSTSPGNRKKSQTNGNVVDSRNIDIEDAKPKFIIPETVDDNIFNDSDFDKTPERKPVRNMEMSPVFTNFSGKKRRGSHSSDGNEIGSSLLNSPIRVVSNRVLLKPIQETTNLSSPVKRTSSAIAYQSTPEKPKTPKRAKKSPRQRTPKKSPGRISQKTPKKTPNKPSQLKRTKLIEAERTQNGNYRKLTQMTLNFVSKKVSEKENSLDKDEDVFLQAVDESHDKILEAEKAVIINDDDVIAESPKRSQTKLPLSFTKKHTVAVAKAVAGSSKDVSQSLLSRFDPEATYVSNSFMCNWKKERPNFDKIIEEEMPKKADLSQTEKISSPSSPPFAYKREAVRKKSERLKLPGHGCFDCDKYYRAAYGDSIPPDELQKIMNKCSRHRDKYPDLNNTPPGYWKPYMTMTPSEFEKS